MSKAVGGAVTGVVLVAHGSRDPRAARSTFDLAATVRAARPGTEVGVAFLDFAGPRLAGALARLSTADAAVVPLLLIAAYHSRVDIPAQLAGVLGRPRLAEPLGPVAGPVHDRVALSLCVTALSRRLREAGGVRPDAVVLAAAGTRDIPALDTVDTVAAALGVQLGVPAKPGYASGAGPDVAAVVRELRAGGARRVAVASYFVAPGRLHDRIVERARMAGAGPVAEPLGDAPEVARMVLHRAAAARLPELV